jgi:hypothetical protein
MAFTPNKNLIADTNVTLRDYQHAAKLFNVDQFRLAPKFKFQFHVAFGINSAALKSIDLVQRFGSEINMMVKAVDLPSFTMQTETLNQYNRKKVVQFQQKYGDINVKFHDDNMGLINQLWQNYYSYYYADSTSAQTSGSYERTATRSSDFILTPYGFDNSSSAPFFNYIKIYQMARHEYVCYTLKNPLITSWNHNKLDYSNNSVNDFDMKLAYEAVEYSVGIVGEDNPEGFGGSHYDSTLSPLRGAPDNASINPSFVSSTNVAGSAQSILNTVITQINTAQNTKTPNGTNAVSTINNVTQALNGLQGFSFPLSK